MKYLLNSKSNPKTRNPKTRTPKLESPNSNPNSNPNSGVSLSPSTVTCHVTITIQSDGVMIKFCCVPSFNLDEKRETKPKFVSESRARVYFAQQLSSNLNKNNVARQVDGFCISYLAALSIDISREEKKRQSRSVVC